MWYLLILLVTANVPGQWRVNEIGPLADEQACMQAQQEFRQQVPTDVGYAFCIKKAEE